MLQRVERRVQNFPPSDDHIVIAGRHVTCRMGAQGFTNAPPDAIARDGIALFSGDGDPAARRIAVATLQNFKQKQPSATLLAALNSQEL